MITQRANQHLLCDARAGGVTYAYCPRPAFGWRGFYFGWYFYGVPPIALHATQKVTG